MRRCKKCNIEKPLEGFTIDSATGNYKGTCKECRREQDKLSKQKRNALLPPKPPKVKKEKKSSHKPYVPIYNEEGLKKCGKCKEFKNVIQFAKAFQSPDLIAHVCSKCRYGNDKEVYAAKWTTHDEKYTPRAEKITTKKCMSCEQIKDKSKFGVSELGFANRICEDCPKGTPEYKARIRKRKGKSPEYSRNQSLKKYGITLLQYEDMIVFQENRCKICNKEFLKTSPEHRNPINVDHCHTTGKVRGLLCSKCNTALGNFNDSEDILLKAIDYLKNSK